MEESEPTYCHSAEGRSEPGVASRLSGGPEATLSATKPQYHPLRWDRLTFPQQNFKPPHFPETTDWLPPVFSDSQQMPVPPNCQENRSRGTISCAFPATKCANLPASASWLPSRLLQCGIFKDRKKAQLKDSRHVLSTGIMKPFYLGECSNKAIYNL